MRRPLPTHDQSTGEPPTPQRQRTETNERQKRPNKSGGETRRSGEKSLGCLLSTTVVEAVVPVALVSAAFAAALMIAVIFHDLLVQ